MDQYVPRNAPCPCGSGLKFKKCCYLKGRSMSPFDRAMANELIARYARHCEERADAEHVFNGHLEVDVPAMTEDFRLASSMAFEFWLVFDYQLEDGSFLVDQILKDNPLLSSGERLYFERMRSTAMLPYEVVSVRPGHSVVLRRLGDGEETEVREKMGSQSMKRWDLLVARLNPLGPSGGPEIEAGALLLPKLARDEIAEYHQSLEKIPDPHERVLYAKDLGAVYHQIWLEAIVDPQLPTFVTSEGDPVVFVRMQFDVHDDAQLRKALNREPSLRGEGDHWTWISGESQQRGTLELSNAQLSFETQSEPRAEQGRQLVERIAQGAVTYRGCDRVNAKAAVEKALRSGRGRTESAAPEDAIPPEIKDRLFQEHMARHLQHWLDDHIPALDHHTPRDAARSSALRPRLVRLLTDLENEYLRALSDGQPGFDPTWIWDELELADHPDAPRVRYPVRLAHQSIEQHLPGTTAAIRIVAEQRRANETELGPRAITASELESAEPVRELLREGRRYLAPSELLAHLTLYSNYELQRRKTFWVDESLAWMLSNTKVDVEGSLLRLPFRSYVLVYTDRHTLSIAERALANDAKCPLRGQMLAVLCAYVVAWDPDGSRIQVGLTFDALAGQLPHLLSWDLHVSRHENLTNIIGAALRRNNLPAAELFRPLLDAVVNATLYTTSAGLQIEQFRSNRPNSPNNSEPDPTGDCVYHLPGKIGISQLRKMRQLARGPNGGQLMHRFMVRGHWRGPGRNWKDQSPRWIEPYWRGPSLASIIEREYRLYS